VHGVIFASYYDFLTARFGGQMARGLFAGEPVYLMSESYDDERFVALVKRACEETNVESEDLLHELGVFTAQKTFARLYPAFFAIAGAARPFLLTIEERIHELVRATIPNAKPPQLRVSPLGEDGVRIEYTSPRQLCVLLVGLVEGTAAHYGELAEISEPECMRRGDPACLFDVQLSRV
jgi:Haem-NO-binding